MTFDFAGFRGVFEITRRVGPVGFFCYCMWSCGVFLILGKAWRAAAPGGPPISTIQFAWARAVREAVADLLPFSQVGGIIVGARTLAAAGRPVAGVYASLIVDMTTELASQLIFTAYGILTAIMLVSSRGRPTLLPTIVGGGLALLALLLLVLAAQQFLPRMASSLIVRVLPGSAAMLDNLRDELARIYHHRGHVTLAFTLNTLAWIASAMGAWIVLAMMGRVEPVQTILTIEALIFTLRSVAFAIPGGVGVQEVAYALIAPALGLPIEFALALALAKRARDIGLGLTIIILWQYLEIGVFRTDK